MKPAGKPIVPALLLPARLTARAASGRILSIAAIALASTAIVLALRGTPGSRSGRLDAIEAAVKRIEAGPPSPSLSRIDGLHPAALLVAVQFVTGAAERSAPFDTALAVAIRMTGEHPKIGPLLDKLLVEASMGVPSTEDLRSEFRAKLADLERDGLFAEGDGSTVKSLLRLSRLWDLVGLEKDTEHQATLQKLSADVANRNLGQTAQLIAKLDGRLREALEAWREKVQRRVTVDAVLTELRRAAFIDLIGEAS